MTNYVTKGYNNPDARNTANAVSFREYSVSYDDQSPFAFTERLRLDVAKKTSRIPKKHQMPIIDIEVLELNTNSFQVSNGKDTKEKST